MQLHPRVVAVDVIGDDVVDAPDELRECVGDGRYGESTPVISLSVGLAVMILGNERERILLMLYSSDWRPAIASSV